MRRIPTHDIIGQRVKVGERATLFSPHGTHYEGIVVQRGGKRWLEVDGNMWIGGIGTNYMIKG